MEEVGYLAGLLAQGRRPEPAQEEDVANLMQGTKRPQPATQRRRTPSGEGNSAPHQKEPSSSTSLPRPAGERNTRSDSVPMEEHRTAEDWAIMEAVERCPVWRTLKSVNLREREKLLAALCMVVQEMVEGNPDRQTVGSLDDFRDWGRRWGQDDDRAQLTLQCQWDSLIRHIMGITAAMEVWEPLTTAEPGENATTTGKT